MERLLYEEIYWKLEIHQKACAEHDRFSAETTERNYVWEAALAAMQGFI